MKINSKDLYIAIFFLSFPMSLSHFLLPIMAQKQDALFNYGILYSSMALAGTFFFLYTYLVEKLKFFKSVIIGLIFYGISMICRIYISNLYLAILAGLTGGFGASLVLLAINSKIATTIETKRKKIVRNKNIINAITKILVSCILLLINILAFIRLKHFFFLLAIFLFCSTILIFIFHNDEKNFMVNKTKKKQSFLTSFKFLKNQPIIYGLTGFNFIIGMSSSLAPFVYISIFDSGSYNNLAVYSLFIAFITIPLNWLAHKFSKNEVIAPYFLLTELIFIACNLAIFFVNKKLVLPIVLIRFSFSTLSMYYESLMTYKLLDKFENKTIILSLSSSSFLIGDMIGGASVGFISSIFGVKAIYPISSLLFLINAIGFFIFYLRKGV